MLIAYLVALIVGGVLVLLSAIGGHGGHELALEHDAHVEIDHGPDLWLPFLSLRFWTYGLAAFGLTGVLMVTLAALAPGGALPWSIGAGILVGTMVSAITRWAMKSESGSSAKGEDFLGKTGRVMVPIGANLPGKVRMQVKGDWVEMLALTEGGEDIQSDEEVVVVGIENDRARVVRKSTFLE